MKDSTVCVYQDEKQAFYSTRAYLVGQRLGLRGVTIQEARIMLAERNGDFTRRQKNDVLSGLLDNFMFRN